MKRKIFLFLFALVLILVSSPVYAAGLKVGFIKKLQTTEEEYYKEIMNFWAGKGWVILGSDHEVTDVNFYDSLVMMILALNSGEVDEIILPEFVAEYVIKNNPDYYASCMSKGASVGMSLGFREKNEKLAEEWDKTLITMRNDFTIYRLENEYLNPINHNNISKPVKFENFPGQPTIKVAVTGDLPPMDYIAEDGRPSGFSTAILAELGKRLKVNIKLVNVDSGSRAVALLSKRVDVVFWYEKFTELEFQPDIPEGVILSEPYYYFDTFIHVRKK